MDKEKADTYCQTPLYRAAFKGHLEVVRYLVEQGADKEKADNYSRTPLHIAAGQGHADVVVCLLSHGAKLNVRDTTGRLPVDVAATEEIKQIIRDEEQRRRDVVRSRIVAGQKEAADHAALMSAATAGDLAVVKEYVSTHKVDVNKTDGDGRAPLFAAGCRRSLVGGAVAGSAGV
jgi:ankyrin repeat protein